MRCHRCGKAAPSASWYCAHCGAELSGVNLADSVKDGRMSALARWSLLASVTLAVALLVVGGAAVISSRGGESADTGSLAAVTPLDPASVGGITSTEDAQGAPATQTDIPRIVTARSASGRPALTPRPDGPVWALRRLDSIPEIDGRLDEWTEAPLEITDLIFGQVFWKGPQDLSAEAYGGWTDYAWYLAVDVADDVFSQPSHGAELYMGDSLELQIDTDLAGDWDVGEYDDDDWQIGLSPGDFDASPPEVYAWRPALGNLDAVRLASRRTAAGYVVEIELPWDVLGLDPATVSGMGMALNVSDNDDPRPAQLSMISSAPLRSWSDPRSFGTVWLLDQPPSD